MGRLHIELQRVETWLFAVPRLPPMVGTDALIVEKLRVALSKLARAQSRGWLLAPTTEAYPRADETDPRNDHETCLMAA